MNSSPIGAHNFIWSSIEVVITRRTRNPLALRGPWVRIPPAPPKNSILQGCFFYMEKGSLQRSPTPKTEKPIRGVSGKAWKGPQNYRYPLRETPQCGKGCARGIISLTLPLVLSGPIFPDLCISGYAHQREESPAALFLIAFLSSVFWYCTVFCLSSADFRRREV